MQQGRITGIQNFPCLDTWETVVGGMAYMRFWCWCLPPGGTHEMITNHEVVKSFGDDVVCPVDASLIIIINLCCFRHKNREEAHIFQDVLDMEE
eukprot:7734172-Ditylum_brightwellii.AAC.1